MPDYNLQELEEEMEGDQRGMRKKQFLSFFLLKIQQSSGRNL